MIDSVNVKNKTRRLMSEIEKYVDINNISFYVYKSYDFPLLEKVANEFVDALQSLDNRKVFFIKNIKHYKYQTKLIMLTLLLNENNVDDVSYRYEELNNFVDTKFKNVEILQIVLNCHYTRYHEYMKQIVNEINDYILKKKANRKDGIKTYD
nr:MAG TPA: hypothetical protein [Caudoviricetes sp.]